MFSDRFDESSADDILRYASILVGRTLADVAEIPSSEESARGKGRIGLLVEKYFFGYEPNNDAEPDFPKANLELKVTGLRSSKSELPVAKERLSLSKINFNDLVDETFETSSFWRKCQKLLILCYFYDESKTALQQEFSDNQFVYSLAERDLEAIRSDWELIKAKVVEGKAHELSEGDTLYLKANRKGAGGENDWTSQPFSSEPARPRGWSFNNSYLTSMIIQAMSKNPVSNPDTGSTQQDILGCFDSYLGAQTAHLITQFDLIRAGSKVSKSVRFLAVKKILEASGHSLQDVERAGIRIKTVKLSAAGRVRESMSFRAFDYLEIAEQPWDKSDFGSALEDKFLLAIFREGYDSIERLENVAFWNMPYQDRLSAQGVWEETKARINAGTYTFPQASESEVAHVRPHGKNSADLLPCPDGQFRQRRSFWLNAKYVEKVVSGL